MQKIGAENRKCKNAAMYILYSLYTHILCEKRLRYYDAINKIEAESKQIIRSTLKMLVMVGT